MSPPPAAVPAQRARDLLIVLLAFTTGSLDAATFDRLGHVFASVITGNLVLLGISAAKGDGSLAVYAGVALGAYALGVVLGAPGRGRVPADERGKAVWPASASAVLALDLLFLIAFTIVWEIGSHHPDHARLLVLLGLGAVAMGVQSTAVRRLGAFSTTYLTSTLTGVVEEIVAWRISAATFRSASLLSVAVAGAVASMALISEAPGVLPVLLLGPLLIVEAGARLRFGRSRRTG